MGTGQYHFLVDKLTLFQPGGRLYTGFLIFDIPAPLIMIVHRLLDLENKGGKYPREEKKITNFDILIEIMQNLFNNFETSCLLAFDSPSSMKDI